MVKHDASHGTPAVLQPIHGERMCSLSAAQALPAEVFAMLLVGVHGNTPLQQTVQLEGCLMLSRHPLELHYASVMVFQCCLLTA
jgi:hypothetical protein